MIGSAQAANTVIEVVTRRKLNVGLDRLQALLYLLDQRWLHEHGDHLIGEPFMVTVSGPRIPHIDAQYRRLLPDQLIVRHCEDAEGTVWMSAGDVAKMVVTIVEETKSRTTAELIIEITRPGLPWASALVAGVGYLHEAEPTR